jgi:sugar phosphate isomerase/epimerase
MHHTDPDKRAKSLADAKRFIDLAEKLDAPYIRIYGNKLEAPQDECIRRVAAGMRELAIYAKPHNVTVIIESHGDFVTSPLLKRVLTQADHPMPPCSGTLTTLLSTATKNPNSPSGTRFLDQGTPT